MTKGKADKPIASAMSGGGAILGSRGDIVLIPGTDKIFSQLHQGRASCLPQRERRHLPQPVAAAERRIMGTAQTQIFPPGTPSHMDHIQSLSSSIDVKGADGWGYSDDPTNFSY